MSLVPAFQIGVWNAWIFMIWLFIPIFLEPLNIIPKGREEGSDFTAEFNKMQKIALLYLHIIYLLSVIYSIFLPLQLGTIWFYVGLPIALIGLVTLTVVMINFATTPWDKPITNGLYHYSRNPMYITTALFLIGVSIASASWLFLLLSIIFTIFNSLRTIHEERFCLEKYGNAYREYMNRTPRWIRIPKSG